MAQIYDMINFRIVLVCLFFGITGLFMQNYTMKTQMKILTCYFLYPYFTISCQCVMCVCMCVFMSCRLCTMFKHGFIIIQSICFLCFIWLPSTISYLFVVNVKLICAVMVERCLRLTRNA